MTKRKPVDEVRWALLQGNGMVWLHPTIKTRDGIMRSKTSDDVLIRVRVTEVPKKKRSKK